MATPLSLDIEEKLSPDKRSPPRMGDISWKFGRAVDAAGGTVWRCSDIQKLEEQSHSIMITDPKGVIQYVNTVFEELTGYTQDEVIGKNASILKSGRHDAEFFQRMWATINRGESFHGVFINRCKNGLDYCEEKTITPIRDSQGEITRFMSVGHGIPHETGQHEKLTALAYYDNLTGLPNRILFHDRLLSAMARARRTRALIAVLFLDLDNFKSINDALGHPTGDKLLKAAAQRLKSSLRDSDTVGRIAGDEFMAVLESIRDSDHAGAVAQKIVNSFRDPFVIEGQEIHCYCSLGIALFPLDQDTADDLIHHADMAMYDAKQRGRNNYRFYSRELNERAIRNKQLEEKLRQASGSDGFFLCYQPLIDATTGRMTAAEALIRWRQPETGLESPTDFFPLIESAGVGLHVGEWVLRTACLQAAHWHRSDLPRLKVCINVSTRQFWHKDFLEMCARVLRETAIDPGLLCLDVAEDTLLRDEQRSGDILRQLKEVGLSLCVDDFAKNCTSLSYLRRTPVDLLKIHRPYVQKIVAGEDEKQIIAAIITLAHHLGIRVAALGVASPEQLSFLLSHRCDVLQGYYFSEPLPEETGELLDRAGWRSRNFLPAMQA